MAHNPGFLKLVNEAKSRVKEIDIDGYKKMLRARASRTCWWTRARRANGPPATSPAPCI